MVCKQQVFDGCCLVPWDVTSPGGHCAWTWPCLPPGWLVRNKAVFVTKQLIFLQIRGFHPTSSWMENPTSHQTKASEAAADRSPVRSPQAQWLVVWKLQGLIPKFRRPVGRREVGIAVGVSRLDRGGNQKVGHLHLLLRHIAWSCTSHAPHAGMVGGYTVKGREKGPDVLSVLGAKCILPKNDSPDATAEGPASAGPCLAACRAASGAFWRQPAEGCPHPWSPWGCARGSSGRLAWVPPLGRERSRPCMARGWDTGDVVSTRLVKECSVYKTMAF